MNETNKRRYLTLTIKESFCDNMYRWNNSKLLTAHVAIAKYAAIDMYSDSCAEKN